MNLSRVFNRIPGLLKPLRPGGRKSRGFALLELTVSVGFTAAIGGLVASTALQVTSEDANGAARIHVAKEVTRIPRWMLRDVHRATVTDIPDLSAPVTSASFEWTDSTGTHICTYALSSTNLERTCDSSPLVVGEEISGLEFVRDGKLITTSYTVQAPGRPDVTEDVDLNMLLGGGS